MLVPPVTSLLLLAMLLLYAFSPPASLSWLYHEQELHLLLNWVWALFTCKKLEKVLGSCVFLGALVSLAFLSWVVVAHFFCKFPFWTHDHGPHHHYMLYCRESHHCFTPVLFSLHFLLITVTGEDHLGIGRGHVHHPLTLVGALSAIAMLQAFVLHPNAPFLHSLTGILIAFAAVHLRPSLIINIILGIFNSNGTSSRHRRHYGTGEEEVNTHLEWQCRDCNIKNGVFHDNCQTCQCPRFPS